jgi:hypothetical protein
MISDQRLKGMVLLAALVVALLSCSLPQTLASQDAQVSPTIADVTSNAPPTLTTAPTEELPPTLEATEVVEIQPPGDSLSVEPNLATNKTVHVENEVVDQTSAMAVDGYINSLWNSGGDDPQWIEIDLGEYSNVETIRLHVSQTPPGDTVHEISGSRNGNIFKPMHIFSGYTEDGQVLEFSPETPWMGIQFIRINTVVSPSWVAWREIEIIGSIGE